MMTQNGIQTLWSTSCRCWTRLAVRSMKTTIPWLGLGGIVALQWMKRVPSHFGGTRNR